MTLERGALSRTTPRLCRIAARSIVAVTRGIMSRAGPLLGHEGWVRQIIEFRVLTQERHVDLAGRARALLADDDLGAPLGIELVRVVHLVAVDEQHQVGVLLDTARFAQVRQARALFVAAL